MLLFASTETRRTRKWNFKFLFGPIIQLLDSDKHWFRRVKGRSKSELHLKGRQSSGFRLWLNLSTLLTQVLCDLHPHFNSAFRHRREERRGHCDPAVTLTLFELLQHCRLQYIPPHAVVCFPSKEQHRSSRVWPLSTSCLSDLCPLLNRMQHVTQQKCKWKTEPVISYNLQFYTLEDPPLSLIFWNRQCNINTNMM